MAFHIAELDGQQYFAGAETNVAEFLVTAAEAAPEGVAGMATSFRNQLRKALDVMGCSTEVPGDCGAEEYVVTIILERGVKCIAAIHAVMLEGCAFAALDLIKIGETFRTLSRLCQSPVMITTRSILAILSNNLDVGGLNCHILDVNAMSGVTTGVNGPADDLHKLALHKLACLVFTQGQSGKPKIVTICHKSVLNVSRVWVQHLGLNSHDRFAQLASMSSSMHIMEVFGAMAAKATSVMCPEKIKMSSEGMKMWLRQRRITGMRIIPERLRAMEGGCDVGPKGLPTLRVLVVEGGALEPEDVITWGRGADRLLFHNYCLPGPETSGFSGGSRVTPGDVTTFGLELPTYSFYILNPETLDEKRDGERGVLFVGGIGLARGYLGEEAETKARFVQCEWGRLYNTGEEVSRDERGRIHYHGNPRNGHGNRLSCNDIFKPEVQRCEAGFVFRVVFCKLSCAFGNSGVLLVAFLS
eukprot:s1830_g23.t1